MQQLTITLESNYEAEVTDKVLSDQLIEKLDSLRQTLQEIADRSQDYTEYEILVNNRGQVTYTAKNPRNPQRVQECPTNFQIEV